MSKKPIRTARRVVDEPRAQKAVAAVVAAPGPEGAGPVVDAPARDGDDGPRTIRKLALIFSDDEKSFDTRRMERSTIERFRVAYANTPELQNGDRKPDDEPAFDVSALIAKGYELLFGSAAALAVRARKLSAYQASAFVNPERIKKLVPRTERALQEKFGDRVRNLPPLAQLSIDIVATLGLMVQDAAQLPEDAPADGAARVAPGEIVDPRFARQH